MSKKKIEEFFLDCKILKNGNNMFSRNIGKLLPTYAAQHPRRANVSASPSQRPEIFHGLSFI